MRGRVEQVIDTGERGRQQEETVMFNEKPGPCIISLRNIKKLLYCG